MRDLGRGVQVQVQEEWRMYHKTLDSDMYNPLPKKKRSESGDVLEETNEGERGRGRRVGCRGKLSLLLSRSRHSIY